MILLAMLVAVLGLAVEAGGIRLQHHLRYQRTLTNIARMESELGIGVVVTPAPPAKRSSGDWLPRVDRGRLARETARWHDEIMARGWVAPRGPDPPRQVMARASKQWTKDRAATPAELAKIREQSYRRWYESHR